MLAQESRQMNTRERNILLGYRLRAFYGKLVFYFILYVLGIGLGVSILLALICFIYTDYQKFIGWICLMGMVWGVALLYRKIRETDCRDHTLEDLRQGKVSIRHIEAQEVIQFGSDDGPAWFFKSNDNEYFFLSEWDLGYSLDSRRFPNKKFTVIRYPLSGLVSQVKYEDAFLKPKKFYNACRSGIDIWSFSCFQVVQGEMVSTIRDLFDSPSTERKNL